MCTRNIKGGWRRGVSASRASDLVLVGGGMLYINSKR